MSDSTWYSYHSNQYLFSTFEIAEFVPGIILKTICIVPGDYTHIVIIN